MNHITKSLEEVGLSKKEALTYITLLKIGKSGVGKISEFSNIKRPTLYLILEELQKKDLVMKIPYNKKQIFYAKDPEEFLEEQKKKVMDFQRLLPQMKSLVKKDSDSKIFLFEGENGYMESAKYKIDEHRDTEFVGFYSHVSEAYSQNKKVLGQVKKQLGELKKRNINLRGFIPDHESLDEYVNDDYLVDMKRLPFDEYNSESSLEIRGDVVRISSVLDEQYIIIDNANLAKTLKQIFHILWKKV